MLILRKTAILALAFGAALLANTQDACAMKQTTVALAKALSRKEIKAWNKTVNDKLDTLICESIPNTSKKESILALINLEKGYNAQVQEELKNLASNDIAENAQSWVYASAASSITNMLATSSIPSQLFLLGCSSWALKNMIQWGNTIQKRELLSKDHETNMDRIKTIKQQFTDYEANVAKKDKLAQQFARNTAITKQ